jgi:hypothetical protein
VTKAELPFEDLEQIYDLLAHTIDDVGERDTPVFLSKLVLLLSHRLGDVDLVRSAVEEAKRELGSESIKQ